MWNILIAIFAVSQLVGAVILLAALRSAKGADQVLRAAGALTDN